MRRGLVRLVSAGAAAALLVALPAAGAAQAAGPGRGASRPAATARALARWRVLLAGRGLVSGPRTGLARGRLGLLYGVAGASEADAWAVGYACHGGCNGGGSSTLIEHWNGARWTRVPSPSPGANTALDGAAVVSATDAWAAGAYLARHYQAIVPLMLHWNGLRWSRVPVPELGPGRTDLVNLTSVTAVSADEAWAAGASCCSTSAGPRDFILHWNGVRWSRLSFASAGQQFLSVTATSARNVWAVGNAGPSLSQPLIVHFNGRRWSRLPSPVHSGILTGVTAVSRSDAWAVGSRCLRQCNRLSPVDRSFLLHWNGRRWASVTTPQPGVSNELTAVTATSAGSAWAVGGFCSDCGAASGSSRVLIERWNGTRWSRLYGPRLGRGSPALDAVGALPSGPAWAVGQSCTGGCAAMRPLTVRWNGRHWLSTS
jgi:hypothetical protein